MKYLLLALSLCVTGCAMQPQESSFTKNGAEVQFLFEHDGIRVYRFYDAGNYVYFTKNTATMWTESDGKASHPMSVNR